MTVAKGAGNSGRGNNFWRSHFFEGKSGRCDRVKATAVEATVLKVTVFGGDSS